MRIAVHRMLLAFLSLTSVFVGGWAYFAPGHFHNNFPGFGMRWLPVFGPFNEHLVKDVGAMYLGLAVLSVLAMVVVRNKTLVVVAAGAWTTFNLLHLVYHVQMLHMLGPRDQVVSMVSLWALLLASLALFMPAKRTSDSAAPTIERTLG